MLDDETLAHQQALLETYRRNLRQAAQHGGEMHAPLAVINSLYETRDHIQQIKSAIRHHNGPGARHLTDLGAPTATSTSILDRRSRLSPHGILESVTM